MGERKVMREIDETTGEIFTIKPGGMYAPFPIPAYQVLAKPIGRTIDLQQVIWETYPH